MFDHDELLGRDLDLGVVVAYGRILPAALIDLMPMVNLHFSLLPRWRGAAPVEHAILAGDEETGVCVMSIDVGLDSGPVHAVATTEVADKTRDELWEELSHRGASLLVETLRQGLGPGVPQQGTVTLAPKLGPSDRRVDWSQSAVAIDRIVRISGAWTTLEGRRLGIDEARPVRDSPDGRDPGELADRGTVVACGDGGLELIAVRPEGRPPMDASSWRHGLRSAGARLGT